MHSEFDNIKARAEVASNYVTLPKLEFQDLIRAVEVLKRLCGLRDKLRTGQVTDAAWNEARQTLDSLGIK